MDSLGGGLEPGRPGAPNALRVSSTVFQDWGNTRNQPVRPLPYFDRARASLTSLRPQHAPFRSRLPVSHRWRSDRTAARRDQGFSSGIGAVVRFEVPRGLPRLNPSPCATAPIEIYAMMSRLNLFPWPSRKCPPRQIAPRDYNRAADDPDRLTPIPFTSSGIVHGMRGRIWHEFEKNTYHGDNVRGKRSPHQSPGVLRL